MSCLVCKRYIYGASIAIGQDKIHPECINAYNEHVAPTINSASPPSSAGRRAALVKFSEEISGVSSDFLVPEVTADVTLPSFDLEHKVLDQIERSKLEDVRLEQSLQASRERIAAASLIKEKEQKELELNISKQLNVYIMIGDDGVDIKSVTINPPQHLQTFGQVLLDSNVPLAHNSVIMSNGHPIRSSDTVEHLVNHGVLTNDLLCVVKRPAPPPPVQAAPTVLCESCGKQMQLQPYQDHLPCAPPVAEDPPIPCERCGAMIAWSAYSLHNCG